ncbi:hypothetical protein DW352_04135 [Pseudolabrys taiwanensis]|uniref:Uncharacterized protein n=2 Tax=Pseudolabrys taiwanensis TaxID=331696 RepID=A0A345ZS81_9HYPH|nr:hypothetical protein DW352_04135 [Pseudolabrys taiwanensis]
MDLQQRWELVEIISQGRMPEGYTASELRDMGLPLPGEVERETQPDGTVLIKQVAPSKLAAAPFVCDTPDPAKPLMRGGMLNAANRGMKSERGRD